MENDKKCENRYWKKTPKKLVGQSLAIVFDVQGELEPPADLCPEADAAGGGGEEEEEGDHRGRGGPGVAVRKFKYR